MITIYGADWCEDTRRARRLLRRLHMPYRYINIDEDLDGLERAVSLAGGVRRTPTIDLGLDTPALVEPDNDLLTGALVERQMLSTDEAGERLALQNVGDLERIGRAAAGFGLLMAAGAAPRLRWPLAFAGATLAVSGVAGWCPWYHAAGVTSLGGPGDRPGEAQRQTWLAARPYAAFAAALHGGAS